MDTPVFADKSKPAILTVTGATSIADKEFIAGKNLIKTTDNAEIYKYKIYSVFYNIDGVITVNNRMCKTKKSPDRH